MTNVIEISKSGKGVYGQEYKAIFKRNGQIVHSMVVFGNDLKWIRKSYTTDFDTAQVVRTFLHGKRKR